MVKVKICGITNKEDIEFLEKFSVNYLGFIMYPPSPRFVGDRLGELLGFVKKALKVAVLVNPTFEEVKKVLDLGVDLIQLHGNETPDFGKRIGFERIIKAFRVRDKINFQELEAWKEAKALLLDTYLEGVFGGTGKAFNWELAREAVKKGFKIFLAGGLKPENILEAIEIVKPYGIDLSSGVEEYPGKKDHRKIEELFERLSKLKD
ncbi:MAG: phosphoribosylanthranilate isomerase [Caldimicrobium sp.]|uniref:N-(5'-phosphoribosyl)anthranilate isomerase n=1 Tax=Caldimicrobium thiodismutans TaxID=1653476 RepID=A0A2N7PKI3_9BACT|nr:MAG: N-(5'-phosphoribosyl)anthranilate isomerase [Caldimicrobium thiodismutans]